MDLPYLFQDLRGDQWQFLWTHVFTPIEGFPLELNNTGYAQETTFMGLPTPAKDPRYA